jgi:signal recognition particle receptor subunit beta
MADFGGEGVEVNARIVYWGVERAGKTTNLRVIHGKLRPDHRGDLRHVPTRLDPTVTYGVLPIELGNIGGVRTRIQIVAAPGGDEHAPTRKQLLDQVDGVVFVVDTSRDRIDENLASFEELRSALAAYGRPLEEVPLVIQYNKRDLGDPFAMEELHRKLSTRGVAAFEATASEGTAVLQTLTTISKRVIRRLRDQGGREGRGASAEEPAPGPGATDGTPAMPDRSAVEPPAPDVTRLLDVDDDSRERPVAALDPELLGADEAGADAVTAVASRAESIFESSFREATHAGAGRSGEGSLVIESVGRTEKLDDACVRLTLVLRDETGRRRPIALTLRLDALTDALEVDGS